MRKIRAEKILYGGKIQCSQLGWNYRECYLYCLVSLEAGSAGLRCSIWESRSSAWGYCNETDGSCDFSAVYFSNLPC